MASDTDLLERRPARSTQKSRAPALKAKRNESKGASNTVYSPARNGLCKNNYARKSDDRFREGVHRDIKLERRVLEDDKAGTGKAVSRKNVADTCAPEQSVSIRNLPAGERRAYFAEKNRESRARLKSSPDGKATINAAERIHSKNYYDRVMADPEKRRQKNERMKEYMRARRAAKRAAVPSPS